ncbi:GGDEF domain-containing protein [Sphingomonas sanguinis]|uniref:diguanylate cyclase n=1 Tax=Sphingomonas sanguinis TaxID=33051 RepID=A0A7Y7QWN9_9SPHN|nr:GGDEF domain-containing protein [Sphingomonas sanguinis]NNG48524.1 GGDEF domain-containing protein [Sphingomonas sanguinis]NVP32033.1 GGDEF domain-containing protein [Sphingomonas sanguinis]
MLRQKETEPVYRELVDALADNVVPMVILSGMMAATGLYIWLVVPNVLAIVTNVLCVAVSLVKIGMILHHQRHRAAYCAAPLEMLQRCEWLHAVTTIAVCVSISLFSIAIYMLPETALHLLPVAIAFGYSAGLIARLSVRPWIASTGILCLVLPNALATALLGPRHVFVALFLAVFAIAGLQSVAFVHATARRAVALRLELESLARRDPLTGLFNRLGLREAFEALAADSGQTVVVHAFDLDGFKEVNDRFGHSAGDRVLAVLASRIQASVHDDIIVARTGGDEFVMVQRGDEAAGRALAHRIHKQLTRPCDLGPDQTISVGLSLGYAIGLLPEAKFETLIHQADERSYAVKRAGGGVRGPDATPPRPDIVAPPAQRFSRRA